MAAEQKGEKTGKTGACTVQYRNLPENFFFCQLDCPGINK
jgi:hypothetical protein